MSPSPQTITDGPLCKSENASVLAATAPARLPYNLDDDIFMRATLDYVRIPYMSATVSSLNVIQVQALQMCSGALKPHQCQVEILKRVRRLKLTPAY